ncbi:hypothetical protein OIU76_009744 [Salix suchowensis]|uniref:Uncharacterized protein n=1 Tax=Salix suchowensis TaxID=1278906 RepID=A0ABQ9BBX2_9ROSI|nr:Transmembrane protein [Salix suchowensis]KAJ6331227.1 hypothetical protein OIU76_009744 [Salix suchowensis]KAJ6362573.1 hypothetical protein OIU78_002886 [Salix suchowensis]KAJ6381758.1 hypothetical protein OIU77_030432 [Salix suchowensis]
MTDQSSRLSINNLRTTSQLIKQTASIFSSNLFTLIFLSLLLFSFRTFIENGTHALTSFIDRDPSLKSLLSRLDLAGRPQPHPYHPHDGIHTRLPRRRRPFLHLTRVGTLDDDFFSADAESDFSLFPKFPPNCSVVILHNFDPKLGFSDFVIDNGIKVPEIVRSGIQFKAAEENRSFLDNTNNNNEIESSREDFNDNESGKEGQDKILDLRFLVNGLELGRRDAAALFFLVSFLSAAYGWVILGFTAIYSWISGVVFIVVVDDLLGRYGSFIRVVWDGSRLGSKRLAGFILMRWAVRDALTQLVGLWYFGEIEDQYSFFKLFVRLKLMPFSVMFPWINGFDKEISGFFVTWMLVDVVVGFIFAVDAWVTVVDTRRTGREILKEGCYLISTMFHQAVQIKCYEEILCGSAARWVFARVFGKFFAILLQSAFEVYFMVAWLIFYFVARCKEADSDGRRFGRRELEGLIDGLR